MVRLFEISETFPTPLLRDFRIFMDSLKKEKAILSIKNQYLPKERLWELNQVVSFKLENVKPNLDQACYPFLHLLYHLAFAGKLAVMAPGKGGRFYLLVSERYEEYVNLTMSEQYFFLLETLWIDTDWDALQKATYARGPNGWNLTSVWKVIADSEWGKTLNIKDPSSNWHKQLWSWGYFLCYFTYFGFWQFTLAEDAMKISRRQIEANTLTLTEFGVCIAPVFLKHRDYRDWNKVTIKKDCPHSQDVLDRMIDAIEGLSIKSQGEESDKVRQGFRSEPFYQAFVPLVTPGELSRTLPRKQQNFIGGTYRFKVSITRGIWRRIEMAAKHHLHALHSVILEAFDFDDDHMFCFFMDNQKWSYDRYTSSFDDDGPYADEVTLGELGLYPGKTFLYLFDYGYEWSFKVEVEDINSNKPLPLMPQIVDKRGTAPNQYG